MKIDNDKNIYLDFDDDYEFIKLISHILNIRFGDLKLKIKNGKPYQIIEIQKSVLLIKENQKNSDDYGG
jgi:hypothetical protein